MINFIKPHIRTSVLKMCWTVILFTSLGHLSLVQGQSITFSGPDTISSFVEEWYLDSSIYVELDCIDTSYIRMECKILNNEDSVVGGADTSFQMYAVVDGDMLYTSDFLYSPYSWIDGPLLDFYDSTQRMIAGDYKIRVLLYDTLHTLLDSAQLDVFVDGNIPAQLVFPHNVREFYHECLDTSAFSWMPATMGAVPQYTFRIVELADTFHSDSFLYYLGNNQIIYQSLLTDTFIQDTMISDQLDTGKTYLWGVRTYLDAPRTEALVAHSGWSFPYMFMTTADTSQKLGKKADNVLSCESSIAGFETGTLRGWVCRTGTYDCVVERNRRWTKKDNETVGVLTLPTIGEVNGRHTIVSGGVDGGTGIPFVPYQGGTYALKLGNNSASGKAESIEHTFTVNDETKLLVMRYALVMDDPGHEESACQPRFITTVYRAGYNTPGFGLPVVEPLVLISDGQDPIFTSIPNRVYRNWDCHKFDLSKFMGQTVTIQIITTDCGFEQHSGYAYIDFCGLTEPEPAFSAEDKYCLDEDFLVDGSASENITEWQWTSQKTDEFGNPLGDLKYSEWFFGKLGPDEFDLTEIEDANFECNSYYKIRLKGRNSCEGYQGTSKIIFINCPGKGAAGPDVCCTDPLSCSFQIGSAPKTGYTYSWSPSNCLSSTTVSNPTFDIYLCYVTLPKTYTLWVTDPDGCSSLDKMTVYDQPPTGTLSMEDYDICHKKIIFSGGNYSTLTWTDQNNKTYEDQGGFIIISPDKTTNLTITATATNPCGSVAPQIVLNANNAYRGLFDTITFGNALSYNTGDFKVLEYTAPATKQPAYNITAFNMYITNRWGMRELADFGTGGNFVNGEIAWDGTFGNSPAPMGVYWWTIELENCDYPMTDVDDLINAYGPVYEGKGKFKFEFMKREEIWHVKHHKFSVGRIVVLGHR